MQRQSHALYRFTGISWDGPGHIGILDRDLKGMHVASYTALAKCIYYVHVASYVNVGVTTLAYVYSQQGCTTPIYSIL